MQELQDFVAELPDPILQLRRLGGVEGKDYLVEKGFIAEIPGKEYFVHARATLPLKDFKTGVGFGLWVKLSSQDFDLYTRTVDHDNLYRNFVAAGNLANTWPGFSNSYGDRVKVRTVFLNEKIYITEYLSEPKDVLMRRSLLASPEDSDTKDHIREMAMMYLIDLNNFAQAGQREDFFKKLN